MYTLGGGKWGCYVPFFRLLPPASRTADRLRRAWAYVIEDILSIYRNVCGDELGQFGGQDNQTLTVRSPTPPSTMACDSGLMPILPEQ